ncbi:MAG: hypothetical protein K1X90_09860 [Candidatus Kapabacteria bacterium]|nr:hypothetical protein [Candidatus Kapabacteria bacterium]
MPKVVVSGSATKPLVRQLSQPSPKPTITEPPHILQRQGIMALELTTEELAKIGIQMLPDGGMRLYAGRPNVNFFRKDSHVVETHTATYTITADSGIEDRIPRQFSPAGIDWIPHSPIIFYTENNQLHLFRRVPNEAYDRHVNVRRPRKTAAEEAADRHFWDSVEYSRFVEPMIMRWVVPVNIKIQNGQRTISLWLSVRRIAPYLPDRYRIPIEAEIKRLTEIDEQQAKELSSKKQTIIAYDISRAPDEPEEDTNAYAIQQHRLMEQARPGDPVMEVWWQSAGAVMVLNVTPNPARDVAEVSFLLEAPRMVALDLYRYDGQRVKRVAEGVSLPAGQHQLRADLHGIQPGLYLLGITTDRSEQALRRVYVTQ